MRRTFYTRPFPRCRNVCFAFADSSSSLVCSNPSEDSSPAAAMLFLTFEESMAPEHVPSWATNSLYGLTMHLLKGCTAALRFLLFSQ